MKITVVTFCKDEEKILPWFLRHYYFADEIHVFDNGSTDHSFEIIRANPKTKIIHYDSTGLDDLGLAHKITDIKNTYYKTLDADWYILVDVDELIWHPTSVRGYLEACQAAKVELPNILGYNIFSDDGWPKDDSSSQLTDLRKQGVFDPYLYSKFAVIYKTVNINYRVGAHNCAPTSASGYLMFSRRADLKLFHYCYLDMDLWVERRLKCCNDRSKWHPEQIFERVKKEKAECIDVTTDRSA